MDCLPPEVLALCTSFCGLRDMQTRSHLSPFQVDLLVYPGPPEAAQDTLSFLLTCRRFYECVFATSCDFFAHVRFNLSSRVFPDLLPRLALEGCGVHVCEFPYVHRIHVVEGEAIRVRPVFFKIISRCFPRLIAISGFSWSSFRSLCVLPDFPRRDHIELFAESHFPGLMPSPPPSSKLTFLDFSDLLSLIRLHWPSLTTYLLGASWHLTESFTPEDRLRLRDLEFPSQLRSFCLPGGQSHVDELLVQLVGSSVGLRDLFLKPSEMRIDDLQFRSEVVGRMAVCETIRTVDLGTNVLVDPILKVLLDRFPRIESIRSTNYSGDNICLLGVDSDLGLGSARYKNVTALSTTARLHSFDRLTSAFPNIQCVSFQNFVKNGSDSFTSIAPHLRVIRNAHVTLAQFWSLLLCCPRLSHFALQAEEKEGKKPRLEIRTTFPQLRTLEIDFDEIEENEDEIDGNRQSEWSWDVVVGALNRMPGLVSFEMVAVSPWMRMEVEAARRVGTGAGAVGRGRGRRGRRDSPVISPSHSSFCRSLLVNANMRNVECTSVPLEAIELFIAAFPNIVSVPCDECDLDWAVSMSKSHPSLLNVTSLSCRTPFSRNVVDLAAIIAQFPVLQDLILDWENPEFEDRAMSNIKVINTIATPEESHHLHLKKLTFLGKLDGESVCCLLRTFVNLRELEVIDSELPEIDMLPSCLNLRRFDTNVVGRNLSIGELTMVREKFPCLTRVKAANFQDEEIQEFVGLLSRDGDWFEVTC